VDHTKYRKSIGTSQHKCSLSTVPAIGPICYRI